MIIDVEKFNLLSPKSNKEILCQCDNCGIQKQVKKCAIARSSFRTYKVCQICHIKDVGWLVTG